MSPSDRKRPRGKVRAKTRVPTGTGSIPSQPPAPTTPRRSSRMGVIAVPVVALLLAIGLGIALGIRSARTDDAALPPVATSTVSETPTTPTTSTAPQTAKQLFVDTCASCHSLADAGATAGIGPNLDEARPNQARVRTTIRNGSLSGVMPANLLVGDDAERVAHYVSRVAGR